MHDTKVKRGLGIIAYMHPPSPLFSLVSCIFAILTVLASPWYHHICNPPVLSSPWYHAYLHDPRRREDCEDCKYVPSLFSCGIMIFAIITVLASPWYHAYLQSSQSSLLLGIMIFAIRRVLSSPWYHHICNPHSPLFSLRIIIFAILTVLSSPW